MKTTTSLFKLITLRPPHVKDVDTTEDLNSNNNETDTSENSNSNTDTNTDNPEGSTPDNNESIQCSHVDLNFKSIISTLITMTPLANSNNLKGLSREVLYKYLLYYFLSDKNRNLYLALIEEYTKRENCNKDMFISILEKKFKNYINLFKLLLSKHEVKKYQEKATKVKKIQELLKKAIDDGVKKIEPNGKILVENREKMPILTELEKDTISVKEAKKEIKTKIALIQGIIGKEEPESTINNDDKDRLVHLKQLEKNLDNESEETIEKYVYKNNKSLGDVWDYSKVLIEEDSTDSSCVDISKIIDDFNHKREIEPKLLLDCANSMLKAYHKREGKSKRQVTQAEMKNLKEQSETFVYVGSKWIPIGIIAQIKDETEKKVKCECQSDFIFHIGDLRVIEHKTVGYLPDEIAHIDNTSPGEKNTRETRRLKRTDTYESLMTDIETVHETDTKSTDRFSLEKAASEVNDEQFHAYAGVKGSANFGTYKVSAFAGVDYTNATTTSNSMAQNISKELVEKTLDRVSKRVRTERSVRTIEEFEEKVTHCVDNTGSSGAKSYVYRWLNKISRVSLRNYGKRLILEVNTSNPACYYMDYLVKEEENSIFLPPNPRKVKMATGEEINGLNYTDIKRDNYMDWADMYKTKLKAPPKRWIIASKSYAGTELTTKDGEYIEIKKDYKAVTAYTITSYYASNKDGILKNIGRYADNLKEGEYVSRNITLSEEEDQVPISLFYNKKKYGAISNIEIKCELSYYAYTQWRIECYNSLIKAYDNLKTEAESKKAMLTYELPTLNPSKKAKVITDELKKRALDCIIEEMDDKNDTENIRFDNIRKIESAYDWDNMSYELHPYFYSKTKDTDEWKRKFYLSDDDPTFEAFLQASYATLRIPLHRNEEFEEFALKSLANVSIDGKNGRKYTRENYQEDMKDITGFEEENTDKEENMEYDINAEKIPIAKHIGDFVIPTNLVILEAGVENGINVRSYPEDDNPNKSVSPIERYYSPAIISEESSNDNKDTNAIETADKTILPDKIINK